MSVMEDATVFGATSLQAQDQARSSAAPSVHLRVLASGSAANCSVLIFESGGLRRACLIDLGLAPRRALRMLDGWGIRADQIDDAILTHLDADHIHPGWCNALPRHARLHIHAGHARGAQRLGLNTPHRRIYDAPFDLHPGVTVHPIVMSHDEHGVVAFRVQIDEFGGEAGRGLRGAMGFATDLGRARPELLSHLSGVNVLAIESNYCPDLQLASDRPDFLKRRIMGGRGHLSNAEALAAIEAIKPAEHVVLLHLSRQCNSPEHVRSLHDGADYSLTIAEQDHPTRWVRISPCLRSARPWTRPASLQLSLFARAVVTTEPKPAPRTAPALASSMVPLHAGLNEDQPA